MSPSWVIIDFFPPSGTYCPSSGCSQTELNHVMLGIGQWTATPNYYILKNSWGTGYVQVGHFYLAH